MATMSSAYTTRLLPESEWGRLVGTEVESLLPGLDAKRTAVIAVEREGEIVGTCVLLLMAHVECLWIAPDYRKRASVLSRLISATRDVLTGWRSPCPLTAAISPEMVTMIEKLGGIPVPGSHFALPLKGLPCRP